VEKRPLELHLEFPSGRHSEKGCEHDRLPDRQLRNQLIDLPNKPLSPHLLTAISEDREGSNRIVIDRGVHFGIDGSDAEELAGVHPTAEELQESCLP
jgi:hypothetical protein